MMTTNTARMSARTNDAIAVAVRAGVPIYVADEVMDRAGIVLDEDGEPIEGAGEPDERPAPPSAPAKRCPIPPRLKSVGGAPFTVSGGMLAWAGAGRPVVTDDGTAYVSDNYARCIWKVAADGSATTSTTTTTTTGTSLGPCLHIMDQSGSDTLWADSNSNLHADNCNVYIRSNASSAVRCALLPFQGIRCDLQ
mgnify:CR=1 FL=1